MLLSEEEVFKLRSRLADQLDASCQFMSRASSACKRADCLSMLLYARRDIAQRRLRQTVNSLEARLAQLAGEAEQRIQVVVKEKSGHLTSEKAHALQLIKEVDKSVTEAGRLLQVGNENMLISQGPRLSLKLGSLMSRAIHHVTDDVVILDFMQYEAENILRSHADVLGYLKSSTLEPGQIQLLDCADRAFVDIEEIFTVKYGEERLEAAEVSIEVRVHDPSGEQVPVERKHNMDGTFTVSFTPATPGAHSLHVRLYGADIPDGPVTSYVSELTSEQSSQDSDVERNDVRGKRRIRVSGSMLKAVRKHIECNTETPPQHTAKLDLATRATQHISDRQGKEPIHQKSPFEQHDNFKGWGWRDSANESKGGVASNRLTARDQLREACETELKLRQRHELETQTNTFPKSENYEWNTTIAEPKEDTNSPKIDLHKAVPSGAPNLREKYSTALMSREEGLVASSSQDYQQTSAHVTGSEQPFVASKQKVGAFGDYIPKLNPKTLYKDTSHDFAKHEFAHRHQRAHTDSNDRLQSYHGIKSGNEDWDKCSDSFKNAHQNKQENQREISDDRIEHHAREGFDKPWNITGRSKRRSVSLTSAVENILLEKIPMQRSRRQSGDEDLSSACYGGQQNTQVTPSKQHSKPQWMLEKRTVSPCQVSKDTHHVRKTPNHGPPAFGQAAGASEHVTDARDHMTRASDHVDSLPIRLVKPPPGLVNSGIANDEKRHSDSKTSMYQKPKDQHSEDRKSSTENELVNQRRRSEGDGDGRSYITGVAVHTSFPSPQRSSHDDGNGWPEREADDPRLNPPRSRGVSKSHVGTPASRDSPDYNNNEQNKGRGRSGSVSSSASVPRSKRSSDSVIQQHIAARSTDIKAAFVRTIGHYNLSDEEPASLAFPIGVTVNSRREVVVADNGHDCVKVFSWAGICKRTLRPQVPMCHPSAVVVNDYDDMFVKDDEQIMVFSADGRLKTRFGSGLMRKPYGLALNDQGHLITLDTGWRNPCVLEFTQAGQLLCKSPYWPLQNPDRSKCRFLDTHRDTLIVTDLGRSRVHVTGQDGRLIRAFGEYGHCRGDFDQPSGVVTDRHGNLLIADSKHDRIQVFDEQGGFKCCVQLEMPIKRPSGIHLTADGYLLVSCLLAHCVRVYRLLPPV